MKMKLTRNSIVSALGVALVAPLFLAAASLTPSGTPVPTSGSRSSSSKASAPPSASSAPDFDQRMHRLDKQLDSIFADTFRSFGDWFGGSSLASSIDLRDQKEKYVVRIYVPESETSRVNATVKNNVLHVTAEGEQKENGALQNERYEQVISLPGPVESDKMQIDRKGNLVVITLPKATGGIAAASPGAEPSASPSSGFEGLDQSIITRMARMQGRMEQIFRDAFPNDLTTGLHTVQLNSAVHLDDQKDRYVVHFYLPDRDLKNVDVHLKNGELRLTASETERSQQQGMSKMESGQYEQLITLPGPVQEKGMKVTRKNGTIVVTLPKG